MANTFPSSGNAGSGTTTPAWALCSHATSGTGDNLGLGDVNSTSSGKQLLLGYDFTNDTAKIQSIEPNFDYKPLSLNPAGGNVGIGVTNPGSRLVVNGDVGIGGDSY